MIDIHKSKISPISNRIEACTVTNTCCLPHNISENMSEIWSSLGYYGKFVDIKKQD